MNDKLANVEGLLFDLGGTLLRQARYHPEDGINHILNLTGSGSASSELVKNALTMMQEGRRYRRRSMIEVPVQSLLRLLFASFKLTPDQSCEELELEFWQASSEMSPEGEIEKVLEALPTYLPKGVVSNAMFSSAVLEWELERNGLRSHFDFVMSSADYAFQKPHSAIFQAAIARLGTSAAKTVFVGDNFDNDVEGAAKAGLIPVWYNPLRKPRKGTKKIVEIAGWLELLRLI